MEFKAGQQIKAFNNEWIVLDPDYVFDCFADIDMWYSERNDDAILCLLNRVMTKLPIEEDDFSTYCRHQNKGIVSYLGLASGLLRENGAKDYGVDLDMTAADGSGWDKSVYEEKGFFLLTKDMYKKYRKYIPIFWDSAIWLATRRSYFYKDQYCCVYENGSLGSCDRHHECGIVPAIVLSKKSLIQHLENLRDKPIELGIHYDALTEYINNMTVVEDLEELNGTLENIVKQLKMIYNIRKEELEKKSESVE